MCPALREQVKTLASGDGAMLANMTASSADALARRLATLTLEHEELQREHDEMTSENEFMTTKSKVQLSKTKQDAATTIAELQIANGALKAQLNDVTAAATAAHDAAIAKLEQQLRNAAGDSGVALATLQEQLKASGTKLMSTQQELKASLASLDEIATTASAKQVIRALELYVGKHLTVVGQWCLF